MLRLVQRFAPAVLVAAFLAWLAAAHAQTPPPVITRAIDVRSLTLAEAEQGRPVVLRGTIIFVDSISAVFVQDETSSTFFRLRSQKDLRPGDLVEVKAKTRMGLYLPGLDYAEVTVLGRSPLPAPTPATYDDLVSGRYHYQRVALDGVVRSVTPIDAGRSLIRLALGPRVVDVRVGQRVGESSALVDCRVRVTGLAVGLINSRRKLVQPYLLALDWNEVSVLEPAPPAAEVPRISAEELFAFRASGREVQRVRTEGVVTAVFPPGTVFLRQGTIPFFVRLTTPTAVSPGDTVEVVGFPEFDSIVDAEIVRKAPGPPPEPLTVNSADQITERHNGDLLSVTGVVGETFQTEDGTAFVLVGGNRTVRARLPPEARDRVAGARVRVTGIAEVESVPTQRGFGSQPGHISLRARSAADLVVLQQPSWWTAQRLAMVLAVSAAITLLAALWIAILRRQVRRQTDALRQRIEAEAALEERQRIAREFHDSLEQELAGVSLRLDALATRELDEKGRNLIAASRNLVSRIQSETRDLISDLRDPNETAGDLVAALAGVAARQSAETGTEVKLAPHPPLSPLPAATVHDLRMIARESVTNALKHGGASRVSIELDVHAAQLVMRIVDNGCGFDVASATRGKRGHFGCAGIRERGRKIGAAVAWHSTPGRGTIVEVTLPLTAPAPREAPGGDSPAAPANPAATSLPKQSPAT